MLATGQKPGGLDQRLLLSIPFAHLRYNHWHQFNRANAMPKLFLLSFLLIFAFSTPLSAKDKDSSLEEAIRDTFQSDDHPEKGKGRPDNPGEHGRENAADKQSRDHGSDGKDEDSWEDKIRDEFEDDKDEDKDKKKKNNKK